MKCGVCIISARLLTGPVNALALSLSLREGLCPSLRVLLLAYSIARGRSWKSALLASSISLVEDKKSKCLLGTLMLAAGAMAGDWTHMG